MKFLIAIAAWLAFGIVFTIVVTLPLSLVVDIEGTAGLIIGIVGTVVCIPPAWFATEYIEQRWIRPRP